MSDISKRVNEIFNKAEQERPWDMIVRCSTIELCNGDIIQTAKLFYLRWYEIDHNGQEWPKMVYTHKDVCPICYELELLGGYDALSKLPFHRE